ncbi:MAG: diacylglycerol kinase family protein [Acidimicrobiia bacterium]|nr:diacylglycerol kinase family protein [Acidimicrobiia bacterium]
MGSRRVSVLVNPAAGGNRGLGRSKNLVAELADRGWTVDLLKASSPSEVAAAITTAADAGMDRLVLAGGDGLIHHALPALVGSAITVGIVPIGTGNDFCRGLGLPAKRRPAIDSAVGDRTTDVDVIAICRLDGGDRHVRYAATVVTAGFSGRVNARANELADKPGFPKGASRYSLATVAEIAVLQPVAFTLSVDGQPPRSIEATLIAVGNTKYFGGGMAVCPQADVTDGAMELISIAPVSKTTFMRVLPLVFTGRYVRHQAVTSTRCRSLTITTAESIWADGEPLFADHPPTDAGQQPTGTQRPIVCYELTVMAGALKVAGLQA